MTLMQVRFAHDRAKLMTDLLDRASATEPTAEGRKFAAEMAALFRYRRVRLWGPNDGGELVPEEAHSAAGKPSAPVQTPDGGGGRVRASGGGRRGKRATMPAADATSAGSATARGARAAS